MASQGRYTVAERMEAEYGSTGKGLKTMIEAGMSNADMGRKYGCSKGHIRRMLKAAGIENSNDGRSRPREVVPLGTSAEIRKDETEKMEAGSAKSREILAAQVIRYQPGTPEFQQVAAEILAGYGRE